MTALPTFALTGIEQLRDRLWLRLLPRLCETLDADGLMGLVSGLRSCLGHDIAEDAVFESVRYLVGVELTQDRLEQLGWRLAGNLPALRAGRSVQPWTSQIGEEWVPLQALQAVPYRTQKGRTGQLYTFQILAGSPCPMKITTFWVDEAIRVISQHVGFSRRGKFPCRGGADLVGLRLLAKLEPRLSRDAPGFHDVACPDSMVTWNRTHVLRRRVRIEPCPYNWVHHCVRCAVGTDGCAAATHPITYTQGSCQTCGNTEAFFDPARNVHKCVECDTKERLRRR